MTDRKKPGVAFWATVVVTGLVLYVASIGPAIWLLDRGRLSRQAYFKIYAPVIAIYKHGPRPLHDGLFWYAELWNADD